MARHGKNYAKAREQIDRDKRYPIDDAISMTKEMASAKFDETVELAYRLGVNPRHADQMVRGSCVLPAGTGKSLKVLVFAKGDKEKEAQEAGADFVGNEDLVKKIQDGWMEFDKCIATPDMMKDVAKLGRVLGPRGMMPTPKVGTVTFDVKDAVESFKKGKVEFKVDKVGNLHIPVGKISFDAEKIKENILALTATIIKLKPSTSKGTYLRNITMSTTMGPGIKLDPFELTNLTR